MSHKIMGVRFEGRSKPAWHKLGNVFPLDSKVTINEVIRRVAGDIEHVKLPLTSPLKMMKETQSNFMHRIDSQFGESLRKTILPGVSSESVHLIGYFVNSSSTAKI